MVFWPISCSLKIIIPGHQIATSIMEIIVDITIDRLGIIDYMKYLSCNLNIVFCNHLYNTISYR
jgi:hypothetical protein